MFRTFEHTADLGLRVESRTCDALFADAAAGLTSILVDQPATIRPVEERTFEVLSSSLDYLLFDWLNELLYTFESEQWLGGVFDVHVDRDRLTARVQGEQFDPHRHPSGHEVKAITYHGLTVQESNGGWWAEVIVDI